MELIKNNGKNIICFHQKELAELYSVAKKTELLKEMINKRVSFDELASDYLKRKKVAEIVGERGAQDRDEHEVFAGLFAYIDFYEKNSEVCFELKGEFNPRKDKITTLQDLINFRNIDSDSDFGIMSSDGVRMFQLKRYRDKINAEGIFNFIKEKLAHYGYNLGDINLLIQLQPKPYTATNLDFYEIHNKLKSLNLKFEGQILISYNQNNEEHFIIEVYSRLAKSSIPIQYPSTKQK